MVPARVVVVGGDAREWHAACSLCEQGFDVVYVGALPARGFALPGDPPARASLAEALPAAAALVGPVRGLEPGDEEAVAALLRQGEARPAVCVVGRPGAALRAACLEAGVPLVDILVRDEFATANAVPTAEGAIVEALLAADVTLARSCAVVLGYGRTGRVLAQRLCALGAETWVVARRAAARAEAAAMGCHAADLAQLACVLPRAAFVFNTIPAPVLTAERLRACRPGTVVVDIASPPGGVDLEAAAALGLVARWPLGIPGRFAPRSAGRILAEAARAILAEYGVKPAAAVPAWMLPDRALHGQGVG